MKKSIGQAKQVTKEQKGKFLNAVCWAFVAKQRHDEWCSSLPLIRSLSLRCATNGQRTKTKTLRFECAESEKLKVIKGQLATEQGGRLLGVLGQQKLILLGLLAWIMLGVWRFEAWEFGGEFKASPFWVSSSFSSSYFVSTYDSLLILVL